MGLYLLVPAVRLGHVPRRLFHVVRREERCDLVIAEEVVEPRSDGQVVDSLCRTLLTISPHQPSVRAAG